MHVRTLIVAILISIFASGSILGTVARQATPTPELPPMTDVTTARGNAGHTGQMPGPGPVGRPELLWTFETTDQIRGNPSVVGSVVYFASWNGKIFARDALSGAEVWTVDFGGFIRSPTVVDGSVYAASQTNGVVALDAITGAERWRFADAKTFESPVVVDGSVYSSSEAGVLYSFAAADGAVQWTFQIDGVGNNTAFANGVVFAGNAEGTVYAVDAARGTERWRFVTDGGPLGVTVVADGIVYQSTVGGTSDQIYAIDAATGQELWRFAVGVTLYSPAVSSGIAVSGARDEAIYAYDAVTGALRWRFAAGGDGPNGSALVGDILYTSGEDFGMYALDAATGQELWRYPLIDSFAGITVTGGVIYQAGLDGNVYALADPALIAAIGLATPTPAPSASPVADANSPVEFVWKSTGGATPFGVIGLVNVGGDGTVYVLDVDHNRIAMLNPDGEYLGDFGEAGTDPGQFVEPGAMAVDPQGRLYVQDGGRGDIQIFDQTGNFLSIWPGSFNPQEWIGDVDSDGNLLFVNRDQALIVAYGPDGSLIRTVGGIGSGDSQLAGPNDVAVDSNGNLYVSECDNRRVSKFDSEGNFVISWQNEFSCIAVIDVDALNHVFVTDADNARIQVFTTDGEILSMWGSVGSDDGQFTVPAGIAVDDAGNVYVGDIEGHHVQKFRLLPPLAPA